MLNQPISLWYKSDWSPNLNHNSIMSCSVTYNLYNMNNIAKVFTHNNIVLKVPCFLLIIFYPDNDVSILFGYFVFFFDFFLVSFFNFGFASLFEGKVFALFPQFFHKLDKNPILFSFYFVYNFFGRFLWCATLCFYFNKPWLFSKIFNYRTCFFFI